MAILHNVTVGNDNSGTMTVIQNGQEGGNLVAATDHFTISKNQSVGTADVYMILGTGTQSELTQVTNGVIKFKQDLLNRPVDVKTMCYLMNYFKQYGRLPGKDE